MSIDAANIDVAAVEIGRSRPMQNSLGEILDELAPGSKLVMSAAGGEQLHSPCSAVRFACRRAPDAYAAARQVVRARSGRTRALSPLTVLGDAERLRG